jgi:hypothetical protein
VKVLGKTIAIKKEMRLGEEPPSTLRNKQVNKILLEDNWWVYTVEFTLLTFSNFL